MLGFTFGGANCVIENFASLPTLAGWMSCAPLPPPPPPFFGPAGILGSYDEIGITPTLVLAFVVGGFSNRGNSGTKINTSTSTCTATDMACTRVNCVFFDQISGTATGLLVVRSGGSFGGEIVSRRFCQKPPRPAFQLTSRSEFTGPRGAGLKNSLKLSFRLSPNAGCLKTSDLLATTLTGRSVRNSLRFEKKLFSSDSRTGEGRRPSFRDGSITEGPGSLMMCGLSSGMKSSINPGRSPNYLRRRAGKKDVWPDCG